MRLTAPHLWAWRIFSLFCLTSSPLLADTRLVLIGGGDMPHAALDKFVDWAKPEKEKTLKAVYLSWATSEPDRGFHSFQNEDLVPALKRKGYAESAYHLYASPARLVLLSADPKVREAAKLELLKNLENTTGVFFSGGDQRDAVEVLKAHPDIATALRKMYRRGVVFGGTSAGTALMSSPMIQGDEKEPKKFDVEEGFGLLPTDVLVDQHFLKRKRQLRLKVSLLKTGKPVGMGVDEDGAVLVENNRIITAVGNNKTLTILLNKENTSLDRIETVSLVEGQKYDLAQHAPARTEIASDFPDEIGAGLGSVIRPPDKKKTH